MINHLYEHVSIVERGMRETSLSPAGIPLNPELGTVPLTTLRFELLRMGERFEETTLSPLFFSLPALGAGRAMNRAGIVTGLCVFVLRRETA